MKIDKVIFSTSERFSVFWNLAARLYKTKLGIHPVCLFFGDRRNVDMSDEFGTVVEMPWIPDIPELIQITWSKFWYTKTEPDTTWLIGDIDLLPLNRGWFTSNIEGISPNFYSHLDADGITQLSNSEYTWTGRGLLSRDSFVNCPHCHETNMPGHYHLATGLKFQAVLQQHGTLEEEIRRLMNSGFRNVRGFRECDPIEQHGMWCAEEWWSTGHVRRAICEGTTQFEARSLRHGIDRETGDRLDKCRYDDSLPGYRCNIERLKRGEYADLHCVRPFTHYLDAAACRRRWDATQEILRLAWNDDSIVCQ